MTNDIAQKNSLFLNKIRSEQRQKMFAQQRIRLGQAKRREDEQEIASAQNCLMEMFDGDRQEYEFAMEMADRLERQERDFQELMDRLEQESINFEVIQRQKDIESIRNELFRRLIQLEE